MAEASLTIDREKSARRIERDIETLAGPEYTLSGEAIRRYAYTPEYRNTLASLARTVSAIRPKRTPTRRTRPSGRRSS